MQKLLGQFCGLLNAIEGLPTDFLSRYPQVQFEHGWARRNAIAQRPQGPIASHEMHPDAQSAWNKLAPEVVNFIEWMSMHQLMLFAALARRQDESSDNALRALRVCGAAAKGGEKALNIPVELMTMVNTAHHQAWLSARNSLCFLGLGSVRDHKTAKETSLLSPEEIAADDAQVKAYALLLADMSEDDFGMLEKLWTA